MTVHDKGSGPCGAAYRRCQWVTRISEVASVTPLAGSPLAGDDKAAGKFPVSGSTWTHLTVAAKRRARRCAASVDTRAAPAVRPTPARTLLRPTVADRSRCDFVDL